MALWGRVVGGLALLVVISYLVQWILPRGQSKATARRRYLRWDVAPLVAFFGAVLLALSFTQALESDAIATWGWGAALGMVVSIGAWLLGFYRPNQPQGKRLGVLQIVRRYGPPVIGTALGLYLAIRIFGTIVQVFAAGTLGVCAVVFALALFVGNKPIAEEKHDR